MAHTLFRATRSGLYLNIPIRFCCAGLCFLTRKQGLFFSSNIPLFKSIVGIKAKFVARMITLVRIERDSAAFIACKLVYSDKIQIFVLHFVCFVEIFVYLPIISEM